MCRTFNTRTLLPQFERLAPGRRPYAAAYADPRAFKVPELSTKFAMELSEKSPG